MKPTRLSDKDFTKLIACLKLTQSDSDGEALAAARGANLLLKANNMTWEAIWGEMIDQIENQLSRGEYTIDQIFDELLDQNTGLKGEFRNLIVSFCTQWIERRQLSPKQRDTLIAAWERHIAMQEQETPGWLPNELRF